MGILRSAFCVNMDETPTPLEISVEGGDRQVEDEGIPDVP
jgi:hypothetical protein